MALIGIPRGGGGHWYVPPRINRHSSLAHGLLFFASMGENGELAAHDSFAQIHQSGNIIHPGVFPGGVGRFRSDSTSPLPFAFYDRYKITTGPFTMAVYGILVTEATGYTLISNNTANARTNQWRILTNFNGTANSSGSLCLYTFGSAAASFAHAASGIESDRPHWYIGVRRADGVLQIWRDAVLLNETAALTLRDVSGSVVDPINMGVTNGNSAGRLSRATLWNRALTPPEILSLVEDPDELIDRTRKIYVFVAPTAITITGTGALSAAASTIAGTAERATTATGALAAQAATVAGTATLPSAGLVTGMGALASGTATISGTGAIAGVITGIAAIQCGVATMNGVAIRTISNTTGAAASIGSRYKNRKDEAAWSLNRITEPTTEPVSLAEAKLHCRVDHVEDDALITALIQVAREQAQNLLLRSLMPQQWELTRDAFPVGNGGMRLLMGPVTGIVSVTYTDTNAVVQTLSASVYSLDRKSIVAWLLPAYDQEWPDTLDTSNAVTVNYLAGYADAASVPASIKAWMLLQIGHWYSNRESTSDRQYSALPFVNGLLDPYRIPFVI